MTRVQHQFLTHISNRFNTSRWLAADGLPPTAGMQRLAFLEVWTGTSGNKRIAYDDWAPIAHLVFGIVGQTPLALTDKGKIAVEQSNAR
jgi:hypothetical protein